MKSLIVSFLAAGIVGLGCAQKTETLPVESYNITVAPNSYDAFLSALRSFAKEKGFRIAIDQPPATPQTAYHMTRSDVEIFGSNPFDSGNYDASFYKTRGKTAASDGAIQALARSFSEEIGAVPGVEVQREETKAHKP